MPSCKSAVGISLSRMFNQNKSDTRYAETSDPIQMNSLLLLSQKGFRSHDFSLKSSKKQRCPFGPFSLAVGLPFVYGEMSNVNLF